MSKLDYDEILHKESPILKDRFTTLQYHIKENYEVLKEKCPITPVIYQSLQILYDLDADEDDYQSWFKSQKRFVTDIEKVIKEISPKSTVTYT